MELQALTPMLWVDDVKTTIDYYVNTLGFICGNYMPEWGWAIASRDKVKIMFAKPTEHISYDKPQFTGSFYLYTDNVDAWWKELKNKADIFYPIADFDYGMREFAIKDCNGYILQFGQELVS